MAWVILLLLFCTANAAESVKIIDTETRQPVAVQSILTNQLVLVYNSNPHGNIFEITQNMVADSPTWAIQVVNQNPQTVFIAMSSSYLNLTADKNIWCKAKASGSVSYWQIGLQDEQGRLYWNKTSETLRSSSQFLTFDVSPELFGSVNNVSLNIEQVAAIYFQIQSQAESALSIEKIALVDRVCVPLNAPSTTNIVLDNADSLAPVLVRTQLNGQDSIAGDFAAKTSVYTFYISESDSGFAGGTLVLNNNTGEVSTANIVGANQTGANFPVNVTVSNTLLDGQYQAKLQLSDIAGNVSDWNILPNFQVATVLAIKDALNGPNPFNPNNESTHIEYQLTTPADVSIRLFTISGKMIWETVCPMGTTGGSAGFNSVIWNGRNSFSEILPNGPYVAYIMAKSGKESAKAIVKILVMK